MTAPTGTHRPDATEELAELLRERILVLDGAMGTMIQGHRLDEAAYRGERFASYDGSLAGDNDLLSISNPDVIREIHRAYLDAGADIICTNTFNGTSISQSDYGLEDLSYEMNVAAATLAREAVDDVTTADRPCFVAGSLGPTSKTASISPDVNDPGARNVDFDDLVAAYLEEARGLVDGGADILLIETIFDTLNAKAAIFAVETLFDERGRRWPVMVSGTITDASGRTLSGQVTEAFWNSVRHVRPLTIGLNCALGAEELRPYVAELSRVADCFVSAHPNAGLPNAFGEYDETPDHMAEILGEFATSGLVNIVGGCCGTTAEHIVAIADAAKGVAPRAVPTIAPAMRLSGLEPVTITEESLFVNVGERTNITGSARFRKLIKDGDYDAALSVAAQQVENGAQVIDVNMDEGMIDGVAAMDRFLKLVASEPDISRVPVMVDSSKWEVIEAGLKCVQGKAIVNSISMKEGEEVFLEHARLCRRYGAAAVVMAFDEDGQADSLERRTAVCAAGVPDPHRAGRLPARGHHLRPERLRDRDRDRGARDVRPGLHRGDPLDQAEPARCPGLGRDLQRQLLVPRQQPGARGDPRRVPVPRDRGRPRHGHRQRRCAGRLRPGRRGAARADRGRRAEPTSRRGRTPPRGRRAVQRRGRRPPRRPRRSGASSRSASASPTRW